MSEYMKMIGVGNHRGVHPSFLSTPNGNLSIPIHQFENPTAREVVPRAFNRMLLIAPKLPFQVVTPGLHSNKPFSMKTALLLMMVLRK